MKRSFCTVCTRSHIPYVLALHDSLKQYDKNIALNVLVVDGKDCPSVENIRFFTFADIGQIGEKIHNNYKYFPDKLRWASKSLFLEFLLGSLDQDAVIYIDNDINFFHDFTFLFDLLEKHAVILTPHWRPFDHISSPQAFHTNFKDGFFNAGCVGASKAGLEAMRWWRQCCEYKIEKNYAEGLYDDQRYLDMLPLIFSNVHSMEHQGCNVAIWNGGVCQRSQMGDKIMINGRWPVVFIHFTIPLIERLEKGKDPLLQSYYDLYKERLRKYGVTIHEKPIVSPLAHVIDKPGDPKAVQQSPKRSFFDAVPGFYSISAGIFVAVAIFGAFAFVLKGGLKWAWDMPGATVVVWVPGLLGLIGLIFMAYRIEKILKDQQAFFQKNSKEPLTVEEAVGFAKKVAALPARGNCSWKVAEPLYLVTKRLLYHSRKWIYGPLSVQEIAKPMLNALSSAGCSIAGKNYCDLGCSGAHPLGVASMMFLNGAASALAVHDLPLQASQRSAEALYDLLVECLAHPENWHWSEIPREDFLQRIYAFNLRALHKGELAAGLTNVPVRYVQTTVYEPLIEPGSIDIMSSQSTLEHFLDFKTACSSLYRLMAPHGVAYHHVDLTDHRAYTRPDINWWSFLTEEDQYEGEENRLRCAEIKTYLQQAGFDRVNVTEIKGPPLTDAAMKDLKGRFKNMSKEELSITRGIFLIRKA